jgi:tetratricopeptide (TPR) repeat protein
MKQRRFIPVLLFSLVLAACLATFLGCPASNTTPATQEKGKTKTTLSKEALEHLSQGQKFLQDQKLDEALKEFQETVRLAPDSALGQFWLGRVYFYRKDKEQAEKAFKKVLEKEPDNYHAMAMLGKMYSFDKDKLEQAQTYLQKALAESPENLEAHFDLARIYAMQGERNKALREFGFLFSKERDFFIYHFELGRMLEAWDEKGKAIEQYKRALVLNPNFKPAEESIQRLEGKSGGSSSSGTAPTSKTAPPKR